MTAPLHTLAVGTQIVRLPGHAVDIGTEQNPLPAPVTITTLTESSNRNRAK